MPLNAKYGTETLFLKKFSKRPLAKCYFVDIMLLVMKRHETSNYNTIASLALLLLRL